ncbi:MAG: lysoplasmalogenase [Flavobacteriales bacterium]|nr:lysoplasmalogenase [Flavobacteriales bacterium]MDW8409580.1 lysoplasmalogenase [Flavobacteriales bacterium]
MKKRLKKLLIFLYFGALVLAIWGGEGGQKLLHYSSKPLLMPLLLGWYALIPNAFKKPRLFFSLGFTCGWLGDIFLMDTTGKYFLAGLASFLVGHLLYIAGFRYYIGGRSMGLLPKYTSLGVGLVFYVSVAAFLAPSFQSPPRNALLLPVLLYSLIICVMGWYAWYAWRLIGGLMVWAFLGAVLFLLSDFFIALHHYVLPKGLPLSDLFILSLYGTGQFLIAKGTLVADNSLTNP